MGSAEFEGVSIMRRNQPWQCMRGRGLLLLVIASSVLTSSAAGDGSAHTWKPLAATTIVSDGEAFITWTPGEESADEYRVYGLVGEVMHLLDVVTDATVTQVPATYSQYAITGVKHELESEPTLSLTAPNLCIWIEQGPPPSVSAGCSRDVEVAFHLELLPGGGPVA